MDFVQEELGRWMAWDWTPAKFVWSEAKTPMSDYRIPLATGVAYIFTLLCIKAFMRDREAMQLRGFTALHNGFLSVLSLIMFCGQLYETVQAAGALGWGNVFCWQQSGPPNGSLYFWAYLFYLSKYYELIDTVLLVLKKKPLDFLHCYHHAIVPYAAWVGFRGWYMPIVTGTLFNSLVHVVMYYYYMQASLGKTVWWKRYLTVFQIVQFCSGFGFTLLFFAMYFRNFAMSESNGSFHVSFSKGCNAEVAPVFFTAAVNVSFLVLFCKFYGRAYSKKPTARPAADHAQMNGKKHR